MAKQDDPEQKARATALRLLARREHSRLELDLKLRQRKVEASVIERVLDEYEENDWLSDERFADVFARQKVDLGYGPMKILAELQQRGIQRPPTWFSEMTDRDWSENAIRLRDRRFGLTNIQDDWDEKGRQGRFLARRGFAGDQVEAALDAVLDPDQSVGGR
ncbi:regulatory protein RecX [Marinobacter sp. CHS3-4]|uniref:regulatory protein RecX n=1 Tax=Marinobacter sp. CHS3-4 TaxID=3045174 RepID=UPI0024B5B7F1|nr:regulatory protein RecX [Marinobacter sp. CHS3-4]MDI9245171.1 regulatory protein RecX [Marinobacter sp. CHS3-4]